MNCIVNLRHLERGPITREGQLSAQELDLENVDELIASISPLIYSIEVSRQPDALLIQGSLQLTLQCECARCLKRMEYDVNLDPWTALVPLSGEDAFQAENDLVDLAPVFREDLMLAFPQHPLCEPECGGLQRSQRDASTGINDPLKGGAPSVWSPLNQLKLND